MKNTDILKLRTKIESFKQDKYIQLDESDILLKEMDRYSDMFKVEYIESEKNLNKVLLNDYVTIRKILSHLDELISNDVKSYADDKFKGNLL